MAAKKSVFWKIYFVILALFALALIIGVFVLINWMHGYETLSPSISPKRRLTAFSRISTPKSTWICAKLRLVSV